MSNNNIHFVPSITQPLRLQEYGVGIFTETTTKSALKKVLKKGLITVNGTQATSSTYITGGETIEFHQPQSSRTNKQFILPLKIIYEDDYMAAIVKPAGIVVSGNTFKTITNALEQNLTTSSKIDACQPQPVHRLDFATSGLLLIGKTSEAIRALNKLFEKRIIKKTYMAVTIGKMDTSGVINQKIENRIALTNYKLIKTLPSDRFNYLNLVELSPDTGRRHQLRIHLSKLGNPILGDKDYTPKELLATGNGMYLHALSVQFKHPFLDTDFMLTTDLPKKFNKLFY